jgi:hypothetical protein
METASSLPKGGMIGAAVGGAALLGIFLFTMIRLFTLDSGKSSKIGIESSIWTSGSVVLGLSLFLGICYAFVVLTGGFSPAQKYKLALALAVAAFFVSNLALVASSIYVQVK